ncbi:MAG: diguanylate cyclase [Actinobacteria bacterium]|nr:diguanylate cyclase [Actinomycetota bacterium]
MSLQQRLTLFFVLIVILPLAAAGFVVQRVIGDEIGERAIISLRPALDATVSIYNARFDVLDRRVRSAVADDTFPRLLRDKDRAGLDAYLSRQLADTADVDFLMVVDGGRVVGSAANPANFVQGFEVPSMAQIARAQPGAGRGFTRTPAIAVRIAGVGTVGSLIGGFWIDERLLTLSGTDSATDLSVVADGTVIASTAAVRSPVGMDVDFTDDFTATLDERVKAAATELENGVGIVASTPAAPFEASSRRVLTSLLVLLGLALLGTTALAYLLARLISQPLEELAQGAAAIAEGKFDHRIPVRSRDEVGQLALAFNDMTARLHDTVGQLSHSRDQLQRAVRRVGDTLRATHDMKQMLESVVNTAADALEADVAILWSFTPTRDELYGSIARGIDIDALPRLGIAEGVVGFVAERASSIVIPPPHGTQGLPRPARHEPSFPVALVTPLYSQDRMVAVLALYRTDPRKHFGDEDVEMVNFLAEQCGVAIENVLLHEEAQRLSLTDGLTGTWNRRFLQMQFRQVLATATRFDRPFSILMLDLDNFKQINDTFGHQKGDEILIEFSRRVKLALREVDTFARYGGEEFISLLAETDVDGAITTAEKIRDAIRSEPFGETPERHVSLTVSIGVASYPQHGETYAALVESADQAMYRAKQLGRDRVAVAEKLKLVR